MEIETIDRRTINESDARIIAELVVSIWPKPGRTVESFTNDILMQWKDYRGPEDEHPRSFVIRDGRRVIAHSTGFPRIVGTSQGDMTILALARVCTDPAVRGKKLGQAIV